MKHYTAKLHNVRDVRIAHPSILHNFYHLLHQLFGVARARHVLHILSPGEISRVRVNLNPSAPDPQMWYSFESKHKSGLPCDFAI